MSPSKRTGIIQLVLIIAFIAAAFGADRLLQSRYEPAGRNGGGDRALYVDTQTIDPTPYQLVFTTTGAIEARTEVNIVPQVTGRIVGVDPAFYSGGAFTADSLLFQIDPRDYELESQRLAAEVARARTALQLAHADAEASLEEWKLTNADKPAPDLVARRPQVAEAEAELQAAEAALATAQLALTRTRYTLPFPGRVLESSIAPGQFVQAGQSYGTAFDITSLEVAASLDGKKLEWLLNTPEATVEIVGDYLGRTHRYEGALHRGAARLNPDTRFASVRFGFKTAPTEVVPGVFARITIHGPQLSGISQIPASALQQDGGIWLVDQEHKLRQHRPDIVYADTDSIALRGLPAGSVVVTNRISGASEGVKVTLSDGNGQSTPGATSTNLSAPAR